MCTEYNSLHCGNTETIVDRAFVLCLEGCFAEHALVAAWCCRVFLWNWATFTPFSWVFFYSHVFKTSQNAPQNAFHLHTYTFSININIMNRFKHTNDIQKLKKIHKCKYVLMSENCLAMKIVFYIAEITV